MANSIISINFKMILPQITKLHLIRSVAAHRSFVTTSPTLQASSGENEESSSARHSSATSVSSTNNNNNNNIESGNIMKSVFISQSYDIFTNLALEDWIYKNFDFKNHHILMLWANDPCVVIGRHQNPFQETNVSHLQRNGIKLARRNSGGGTVFHDRGNLNCTFFTPRERYNRDYNLNIITRALFREWNITTEITKRDDITLMGKKISGTAAKLGHPSAYHHCTLLVNSNKSHLGDSLIKDEADIVSKATTSTRSSIKNLVDVNRNVNVPQLLSAIGYEYLRTSPLELVDGGRELAMKQRGFQLINPTEKWFPGLSEIRNNFSSWNWCFGKTPQFTVQKVIEFKADDKPHNLKLNIDVKEGIIDDIYLVVPNSDSIPIVSSVKGKQYSEDSLHGIINALKGVNTEQMKHVMNNGVCL